MAYRIRASVNVDWVGPGAGPMTGMSAPLIPGGGSSQQTLQVDAGTPNGATAGEIITGTGTGGAIAAGDITNLLTALTTDISAQLNLAANLAKMQGWSTGGL